MDRIDIVYRLKKKGYSLTAVAREANVAKSTVTDVLRDRKSRRVASVISRLSGVPLSRLFPDGRYDRVQKSRRSA